LERVKNRRNTFADNVQRKARDIPVQARSYSVSRISSVPCCEKSPKVNRKGCSAVALYGVFNPQLEAMMSGSRRHRDPQW
jgi:hypothetical protein